MVKRFRFVAASIVGSAAALVGFQMVGATAPTPDYSGIATAASDQVASVPSLVAAIGEPLIFVTLTIAGLLLVLKLVKRVVAR